MGSKNIDVKLTAIMVRCRNHDIKQISEMTGATKEESAKALFNYGNKFDALKSFGK